MIGRVLDGPLPNLLAGTVAAAGGLVAWGAWLGRLVLHGHLDLTLLALWLAADAFAHVRFDAARKALQ